MRQFKCAKCGNRVFFENVTCIVCGTSLGFDGDTLSLLALAQAEGERLRALKLRGGSRYSYCANSRHAVCNWLTKDTDPNALCRGCSLNRTIPNLSEPGSLEAWRDLEHAKKRLLYSLLRFELPFDQPDIGNGPLVFDFVRNASTGHVDGVITIDIAEADAVERERQRQHFQEPYRSLLGHLRHESGHYYFPALVASPERLAEFRRLFGDERDDYGAALARHHAEGPRADWPTRNVSAYASAHPSEDWAETFAHYLHIVDALDTAEAVGLEPRAAGIASGAVWQFRRSDPYSEARFESLIERWLPLTLAMNSLNRSMGIVDFYPFVLPQPAIDKLAFVHRAVRDRVGPTSRAEMNFQRAPPEN